jgi:hypothetical protein
MNLLWAIVVLVLVFWLFGFLFAGVGSLIHLLLIVCVVVVVIALLRGGPILSRN